MTRRLTSSLSHRSSSSDNPKRKLDENGVENLLLPKMKRHEVSAESSSGSESTRLQIFVRMMSGGKTTVIHADKNDTVEQLHHRIELKTKIPAKEQRVIYKGKQLQLEHSLSYYSIEQDSSLHLLGRMQSTEHPVAWRTVDDIMYAVSRMLRGDWFVSVNNINDILVTFFDTMPKKATCEYLEIFLNSSVPAALVMLFASPLETNKSCAKSSIKLFFDSCIDLPDHQQRCFLPVVLEFFRLLRKVCPRNKLYVSCRNTLGSVLESVYSSGESRSCLLSIGDEIFPCVRELAKLMVKQLVDDDDDSGPPSSCDVQKVSSFWLPLRYSIQNQAETFTLIAFPLQNNVQGKLYHIFEKLLNAMGKGMSRLESILARRGAVSAKCSHYLAILKIVSSMSELYQGGKERVARLLSSRKASFGALVLKFAKRGDDDDHQWIFEYKEATTFESRRHLAMLLFPDVEEEEEDYEEMHEMLIDRSNLLAESFEYITEASSEELHGRLFMEFKNEEATGPGVLREWFYLLCQEIFNPQNTLFTRSADDFRRFSPNPASEVDPLHLDYFEFTGRVIALALMHKVQVGVLFDRVFFLQLTGKKIGLEDIKNTDRIMYNSCKQILEMDPECFDSDAGLGLTFVSETEVLGKRETKELLKDGKSIAVNSKNREQYVNLLIKHRFATSVSEQVNQFSQGFSDILADTACFFERLYVEDFDCMLGGGDNLISIDDWKAHTEYNGFKKTDRIIGWFWKILKKMTEGERRSVLFFWTSTRFIPVEGFRGLSSKLYIYRLHEAKDHLPTSHTCFYRLCLPKYPKIGLMEKRLRLIAQDHVSSSFGQW
ncbi:PREDICTED: E3 ubiquitin-protein ligase UPL5-like [Brassica oleracea var. oleracea]|uniref:HECT-type E3 ubiquitin transferase n=1 Tax=Brassica oleracea var. oleracea TaxID=109376 RepID=A0A0D3ASR6_BRAOL|nr:PREDICTED: E3 ubiquitin-protein ligase UPL5-like [Brassica oleracea var. oleracea]